MSDHTSETFNVWSHLICATSLAISTVHFTRNYTLSIRRDELIILLYLTAPIFCFSVSTIYHISASYAKANIWQRIDHLGIAIIIWASTISFIHFAFIYKNGIWKAYIALISISAISSIFRLWQTQLDQPSDRIITYIIFGGLATLPVAHLSYQTYRRSSTKLESCLLRSFWCLVALNTTGGLIYTTNLLQFIGEEASHNDMHVTAAIGVWVYRQGLISIYQFKRMR